jgi:hypothetical protein
MGDWSNKSPPVLFGYRYNFAAVLCIQIPMDASGRHVARLEDKTATSQTYRMPEADSAQRFCSQI